MEIDRVIKIVDELNELSDKFSDDELRIVIYLLIRYGTTTCKYYIDDSDLEKICKEIKDRETIFDEELNYKVDKILNNIQLRQKNLLYHKNGLYDNKELTSFLPLVPFSLSSRQHFILDGSELETISQNKDTSILKKYSLKNKIKTKAFLICKLIHKYQ